MRLLISVESIYIVYMFNYFKTDVYFNHPFDLFTKNEQWIIQIKKIIFVS